MAEAIDYILIGLGVIFTLAVPLAIFGLRLQEGFWSNTICFSNITFASLIAFNYYEPIAGLLVDAYAGGLYLYDYLSFWLLFALAFFLLNVVTNRLSKVRVHFPKVVEQVGNGVLLFGIFFNFASMIFFTLPMAPFHYDSAPLMLGGDSKQTQINRCEWPFIGFGFKSRLLSRGTLVPFTGENVWDDPQKYVSDQIYKRGALVDTMYKKGNSMLFDGTPPPRRTQ